MHASSNGVAGVPYNANVPGTCYPQMSNAILPMKRRRDDEGSSVTSGVPGVEMTQMGAGQGQQVQADRPKKRHRSNRGSDQLLVGPQRGSGVESMHQRHVVHNVPNSHFPYANVVISGTSNQAGAASLPQAGPSGSSRREIPSYLGILGGPNHVCTLNVELGHACRVCHEAIMAGLPGIL
ncbi:hypothetical protein NMY22_g18026 [Coprinellus aureogranulatus]|nr:hypothetical protein NMY22_g18026 [Coprinellus aureogranulatus]